LWYWASAGKTLTATLTGIAQQEGYLQIEKPSLNYLGVGWSSLTPAQENQITVRHHLTMTTGLDDGVADPFCTDKSCLIYKAPAGTRWAYHNAPYTILDRIIAGATRQNFDSYFNSRIRDKIGMDGLWLKVDFNNVYYSTARAMARFGLLALNIVWQRHDQYFANAQLVLWILVVAQWKTIVYVARFTIGITIIH
jgi:CubicO group peptidase (beta-lactamase class C family)